MTERAQASSPVARPFLKWAGGKRQLLPELVKHVPKKFKTYHEPFVGAGALFFELRPKQSVLCDSNERLIRTYRGVRDSVEQVIAELSTYPFEKEFFLTMREKEVDPCSDADVAAWMIYLNRSAFNGLYRVNSKNKFNVPFGRYTNPTICDADNLRACAMALARTEAHCEDFATVLTRAVRGDFVYFDPPYMPLSATSSFTSYTKEGFDLEDQKRLRDIALELKRKGVFVLLSNAASEPMLELYSKDFTIHEVKANRAINSKSDKRGAISEFVIV
jgi:DNA adenine methylase